VPPRVRRLLFRGLYEFSSWLSRFLVLCATGQSQCLSLRSLKLDLTAMPLQSEQCLAFACPFRRQATKFASPAARARVGFHEIPDPLQARDDVGSGPLAPSRRDAVIDGE
jgi:hypothetical protein